MIFQLSHAFPECECPDADFTLFKQDDGVIPPQHTRRYLGLGLRAAMSGRNEVKPGDTKFGVFRM